MSESSTRDPQGTVPSEPPAETDPEPTGAELPETPRDAEAPEPIEAADLPETPSEDVATEPGAAAEATGPPGEPTESTADQGADREPPPPPEEVEATAKEFLAGLLEVMGLESEISSSISDSGVTLDISGESMGVLIGRRGQTLDALQEVTRTAVQRRLRARVRLVVDVEGYRARRRDSLADYARSMAERAKARGTEIELEPMSAYERKVVHDAVGEIDGASSFSEGEEPNRKVIIRGE